MIEFINTWIANIQKSYCINPYIFAVIYVVTIPPFWYSFYKMVECIKKGKKEKLLIWVFLMGFTIVAPFLYVAVFGRNLPVWFWFVITALLVVAVISAVNKIRGKISK
ncbi:MAG: hypothetical protein A2252_02680 [Elusimicrobia bacterium RIFOXYA2_FULL_39_19]|nr:MAG: hypothetical protein A2252_02680 [Elusimicrobia bacterium RIFOXYA2_FULL_39_19]